ncbi:MAG TPA: DUF2169 domain-containing protein [Polyangium sp.]|nr:DUF2169 domain-containing protein [Polyangium sp.]
MHLVAQSMIPVAKLAWRTGHGGYAITVVCKATFELQPNSSPLAKQQEPIIEADEWSESGSLVRTTDLVPFKTRSDVLVVGDAYAPEGRPVASLVTRLVVGDIDKSILVVGERYVAADGRIGEPGTFVRMPLVWERATAARDNPVGKPFDPTSLGATGSSDWLRAPNLYPAGQELPRPVKALPPMTYAPISPRWPSRVACLQQHAATWEFVRWQERPLPSNIDLGYMNVAPADQQRNAPFADETIYLENLHPRIARLSTRLQNLSPLANVDRGTGPNPLALRCDTLTIDTNRGLAMLVWRGNVIMDQPDPPGRIVVVCLDRSDPVSGSAPQKTEMFEPTTTILKGRQASPSAVLPFGKSAPPPALSTSVLPSPSFTPMAPPPASAPAVPPSPPKAPPPGPPSPPSRSITMIPGIGAGTGAALPFGRDAKESPPSRPPPPQAPSFGPPPDPPARKQLDSIPPSTNAFAPPPIPPIPPNTNAFVPAPPPIPPNTNAFVPAPPPIPPNTNAFAPPPIPPNTNAFVPAPSPMAPAPMAAAPLGSLALGVAPPLAPPPAPLAPVTPAVEVAREKPPAEPPDTEARLRLIQRAIWKGDRPIQQILSDHGLSELEWRAAKRTANRKGSA